MKRAGLLLLLGLALSLRGAAQQSPLSGSLTEFLEITDQEIVEKWSRDTYGQEPDLNDPWGDTQFLLSLTPAARHGAFLFKQRCNGCHGTGEVTPTAYGPLLSKRNVLGREDAVRRRIMEGSPRMPAFKYGLELWQIDMVIEYLARVELPDQQYCCDLPHQPRRGPEPSPVPQRPATTR